MKAALFINALNKIALVAKVRPLKPIGRFSTLSTPDIYQSVKESKQIVVMAGAGLSTPSGIPDFRSPKSGIYSNLEHEYNLPYPEAIFELNYFMENPRPFINLAMSIYPGVGNVKPNLGHYFVRLLEMKGKLLRMYTQNIDGLERLAGISDDLLVEAHGGFHTASCIGCGKKKDESIVKKEIMSGKIPRCDSCKCFVKPDIVFFGEHLPQRFSELCETDIREADLLMVIGTSLVVYPFSNLADQVSDEVPRVLINNNVVGSMGCREKDYLLVGDIIEELDNLASDLGWKEDLKKLMKEHINSKKSF